MKKNLLYIFAASLTLFSACSTDLDVNGDWKETMVVYGLLDQSQPKQYIKINKAFLGEGNALEFAQIKDSVQYFYNAHYDTLTDINGNDSIVFTESYPLSVKLVRLSDNTEYHLRPDTSFHDKEDGVFYSGSQTGAIFSSPVPLVATSDYKLVIRNGETGQIVESRTPLVYDFSYTAPNAASPAFYFVLPNNDNFPFKVQWTSAKNARLYQLVIRFNYIDSTLTGNDTTYLDWVLPTKKTQGLSGGEQMEYSFRGQDYLSYIGNKLCNSCGVDANILHRRALKTDLIMVSAADDLNTFIEVNVPSTGIIQTKPEFTNISNGLGLFSSRLYKTPFSRPLEKNTIDSLACGRYTKNLRFLNFAGIIPACP